MSVADLTPSQIQAMSKAMGHRVDPNRLETLTAGVNRLLAGLAALDTVDISNCERAETIDLLNIKLDDIPKP